MATICNKNSAEVDIAPAFGEITTACNVEDNYYARFHPHREHCCKEINFISRLDVNFLDLTQNIDKVSGALNEGQGHRVKVPASRVCQGQIQCKVLSSQLPLLQRNELYF